MAIKYVPTTDSGIYLYYVIYLAQKLYKGNEQTLFECCSFVINTTQISCFHQSDMNFLLSSLQVVSESNDKFTWTVYVFVLPELTVIDFFSTAVNLKDSE